MKITHLYHSGVIVELKHHILLFDYEKGKLDLNPHKSLYVFVSHSHADHFNPDIFQIQHPRITYILSSDIPKSYHAYFVDAQKCYIIADLFIKTLLSTDKGCAFIVKVENQTIYHAGDLNWWHWDGESQEDNDYQRIVYQQQIDLIQQPIDIAFVVVDPRQEKDYLLGLQYFLKRVQAKYIFPIHYFGDYSITEKLEKEKLDNPYQAQIIQIHHPDEIFEEV